MIVAVLFAVGQICGAPGRNNPPPLETLAPKQPGGWKSPKPDETYNPKTLHKYINGASEIYKAFRVRRVLARHYVKQDWPAITLDLFEMATPEDAFGAYHHDIRAGQTARIGQESEYEGASLVFWKGPYIVYITSKKAPDPVRAAIFEIGRSVAEAIPNPGNPPQLLRELPEKGRLPGRLRYFHDHFLLNLYYYVSDDNLLNLGRDTDGVMAWYETPDGPPMTCVVIAYKTQKAAKKACKTFMKGFLPDAGADGIARLEDGRWCGARRDEKMLRLVFDAPTRQNCLESLARKEESSWFRNPGP